LYISATSWESIPERSCVQPMLENWDFTDPVLNSATPQINQQKSARNLIVISTTNRIARSFSRSGNSLNGDLVKIYSVCYNESNETKKE